MEIYKIYLELDKPAINRSFLIEVRKSFDARPKSKLKNSMISLPSIEQFEKDLTKNVDVEDIVRSVRRGIKAVEKTLKNVSLGKFP